MYNNRMERKMPHIVYTERTAQKRRFIRTDGALYVILLLGIFGAIFLSHVAAKRFGTDPLFVQIGLCAGVLGVGYRIYRVRLIDYLYELYDTDLRICEVVGRKQKQILSVPLDTVTEIGAYRKTGAKAEQRTFHGTREKTTAVWFTKDGEQRVVCLNASDMLMNKLAEAVHADK